MKSPYQRRRPRIRQTMKVLAMIGVLLHLVGCGHAPVVAAEQAKETDQTKNRKHSLSEQFVRSLSLTKGSDRRALQLHNIATTTLKSTEKTQQIQRMTGLSRRMEKHRTMKRRKERFHGRQRRNTHPGALNGGGRGVRNGKWKPAGWNGSSKPGGWNGGGGDRYGGKSLVWGSPWGQGWGGSVKKPGYFPSRPYNKPPRPTPKPKPTKPSPKPSQNIGFPTPQPTDDFDVQLIQITMDGMLTAIDVDVPAEGSQDMETLADVFQRTIRGFLGEEYRVDVYEIGGVSVNGNSTQNDDGVSVNGNGTQNDEVEGSEEDDNSMSDSSKNKKQRKKQHRNLQTGGWIEWDTSFWEKNEGTNWEPGLAECPLDDNQIPVLFELKVIRPCFNCDEERAFTKGIETFRETFAVLDSVVKSGYMSRAFCMNAMRAGVAIYPCGVRITCVMGASFYYQFVDEIIDTSQPTASPQPDSPSQPTASPQPDSPSQPTLSPQPDSPSQPTLSPQPDEPIPTLNPTLFPTLNPTLFPTPDEFFPTLGPTLFPTPDEFFPTLPPSPTLFPTPDEFFPTLPPSPTLFPTPDEFFPTLPPSPTLFPTPDEFFPTPEQFFPTYNPTPNEFFSTVEPTPDSSLAGEPTPEPSLVGEPTPEPSLAGEPTPDPSSAGGPTPIPTAQTPTPSPPAFDDNPTFQPTLLEGKALFIFGSSESVGNTEVVDYEVPSNAEEDVIYASAGSEYTLVVLGDESAAVAGYIDKITDYSGYFGLPQQDLLEGSNELAILDSVVNLEGDSRPAPNFRKVYAGVKTNDGAMHSAFVDVDGNVYTAGSNNSGQLCIGDLDNRDIPHQIDLGETAVSVAVGGDFTLILGASGNVYGCGSNEFGQLGLGNIISVNLPDSGNGLKNVRSISAGLDFSLLTTPDGLVVMGSNGAGQLCTDEFDEVKEPYVLGPNVSTDITQFRAGFQSSYLLFRDGSVVACGGNEFGQLGIGKIDDPGPDSVIIPGGNFIKSLGVGPSAVSAFFVASDGVVYGTGRNNRGQLGVGDRDDRDSPDQVLFEFNGDDVTRISAAFDHTLAW